MKSLEFEDLNKMADEIEDELGVCRNDLRKIGTLNIKAQSYMNILSKQNQNTKEFNLLKERGEHIQNNIKVLSDLRKKEKQELEQEMSDSKINFKRITEARDSSSNVSESDFFHGQSSRLDRIIHSSMDSLESIKRQGNMINSVNDTLRRSFIKLGAGSDLLQKIESRVAGDKSLFLMLICILIALIILLKLVF